MRMQFESIIYPSSVSLAATYQVMLQQEAIWIEQSQLYTYAEKDAMRTAIYNFYNASRKVWAQTYQYTILSQPGFGIQFEFVANNFTKNQISLVSIYDGPVLVYNVYLHAVSSKINQMNYTGGNRVVCGIYFPNPAPMQQFIMLMFFAYQFDEERFVINHGSTVNLTINTIISVRRRPVFYYRYIQFSTRNSEKFLQLTVTNITSIRGSSYNCENGGFALAESEGFPRKVMGPYCTRTGVEPLLNDINTFVTKSHLLYFLVYSYTFELDMNITIRETTCEGITNACATFCGVPHYLLNRRMQYYTVRVSTRGVNTAFCRVFIILEKGCVVLQRIPINSKKRIVYRPGYFTVHPPPGSKWTKIF